MQRLQPQPAPCRHPCTSRLHRRTLPRISGLVRPTPRSQGPSVQLPRQSALSRSRKSTLYWMPPVRSQNSAVGIEHYCFFCTTREHGQKKLQNSCIEDLSLHSGADGTLSSVCLHGKGGKVRICPLWASTTVTLKNLVAGRDGKERVFLNRRSEPLTRFGIHEIVTRYARAAMSRMPDMRQETDRPSHHPPHDRHASSSCRCRHQYHPCLARPRLYQHHQHLR